MTYGGPLVLVVIDGMGLSKKSAGNAVTHAHAEFLNYIVNNYPSIALRASGKDVGILDGQMGNSEVGHIALGCGQIIKQGVAKIEDEFESGKIWNSDAWLGAINNVKTNNSTLHFSGIFSDGGVHSDINHLLKMLKRASEEGIKKVRIHLVLDGRDVAPKSAEEYIKTVEDFIEELKTTSIGPNYGQNQIDYKIVDGGGRMVYTADRYENDWGMVKKGWDTMVYGIADHSFGSAMEAIKYFRDNMPDKNDQYLPSFTINSDDKESNLVKDGDSFIYYDFRADRAIEIAQAFTYDEFPYFDRGTENNRKLNVYFAGMTEYNSDTHVPEHRLVEPVVITNSLHEVLSYNNKRQLAIAETVKFGHITYYFDGCSYDKLAGEDFMEIPSDTLPFNQRPWMKSAEITDFVLDNMANYDFVRINFAAPDMVGHFGEMETTIIAIEAVDVQLARLAKKVDELGGMMIITADHGNAEELQDENGEVKTSHSTNLVPCIFYDNSNNKYNIKNLADAGISNIAPTIAKLLDVTPPDGWRESLI